MTATLTLRIGHEATALRSPFSPLTAPQRRVLQGLKNVALFLAAPFIGLAYIALTPFVGLGFIAWMAARALLQHRAAVRRVGLLLAAPFIGLAFIVLMPFAGLVTLAAIAIGQPAPRQ
jgi:hypothetical protein